MFTAAERRSLDAAPAGPGRPSIRAHRQQIDNRSPFVTFSVDTGGLPYYEVVLTTDRALFLPASSDNRNDSNFYTSRKDSGLISSDAVIYMPPTRVLQVFARSRAIYYTVIAYRGKDLSGAVPAADPPELARAAPGVSIAAGFEGRTLSTVLGVPVERLARLREDGTTAAVYQALAVEPEIDAAADRAEGEDGYGVPLDDSPLAAPAGYEADTEVYDDGFGEEDDSEFSGGMEEGQEGEEEEEEEYEAGALDNEYSDESAQAPAMLEDEDYNDESAAPVEAEDYDDGFESGIEPSQAYGTAAAPAPPQPIDIAARRKILSAVAPFESGKDGYAAINPDNEHNDAHPAYRRWHVGLSFGFLQFTQDSGSLGRLLASMRKRDDRMFRQVFGPDSDELVRVTNLPGPSSADSPGGRGPRVQPVGGADLWQDVWTGRFRESARAGLFGEGRPQLFNGAQNELADSVYLEPMLRFAGWLGLNTERGLAMLLDAAVRMGVGGARSWIAAAVGPIQTPALRQQALAAVGHADLKSFQQATAGLEADGQWGPMSHAALVAALRGLGSRSPAPVPTREQMLDAIVRRANGEPWAHRPAGLRKSSGLTDVVYDV